MNIETITTRDCSTFLKFGWNVSKEKYVGHIKCIYMEYTLTRDKEMKNYQQIVALERKYNALRSQLKTYKPMDPSLAFVAFICLIIPFVIYAAIKSNQKKEIEYNNAKIKRKMDEVLEQVQPLL